MKRPQSLGPLSTLLVDLFQGEGRPAVYLGDESVGLLQDALESGDQRLEIHQVGGPDACAGGFVAVGRAHSLECRAKGSSAAGNLCQSVQRDVVRHDEVGALAYNQATGDVDPSICQAINLVQKYVRVDDHAVPDDAEGLGPEDARRHQVEGKLPLLVQHGMAGVVSAGKPRHDMGVP